MMGYLLYAALKVADFVLNVIPPRTSRIDGWRW